MPYNSFLISNKVFNYKQKNFGTLSKKSDPVKKYQSLKKGWEKTKNLTEKEGRKLNLAERILNSKPEERFYRYVNKADLV